MQIWRSVENSLKIEYLSPHPHCKHTVNQKAYKLHFLDDIFFISFK